MATNVRDVVDALNRASHALYSIRDARGVDDIDESVAQWEDVETLCDTIKMAAHRHSIDLRRVPRTERQMVNVIVKAIEDKPKDEKPLKQRKLDDLPGGVRMMVMRRADGLCEICGTERKLSIHHIIPRAVGGLDDMENLVVLCKDCHDEAEEHPELNSRPAVLQWGRLRVTEQENEDTEPDTAEQDNKRRIALEKSARTKEANAIQRRAEAQQVNEWAEQWQAYAARSTTMLRQGDPEIKRPEKLWHVLVYGSGKAAYDELKRQRSRPTR